MRPGHYTFSVKKKDSHLAELADEYKLVSIRTGVSFSRLILDAMALYKQHEDFPGRAKDASST